MQPPFAVSSARFPDAVTARQEHSNLHDACTHKIHTTIANSRHITEV